MSEIDLAVVTSVWGDYGKYLPAWAESIAAQTVLPKVAAIIDFGVTDTDPLNEAQKILLRVCDTSDMRVYFGGAPFTGLGAAKNYAVSVLSNEWIIHLDADDELLPHAIYDVEQVHEGYDVVSLGAVQEGRARVYPYITRERILAREHGMFSCGAFRREFWERRPWHTRNDWVDSTFWVGLAHLGARFTSTGRVGFVYNQHEGSISHGLTSVERQEALRQWKRACTKWTLN